MIFNIFITRITYVRDFVQLCNVRLVYCLPKTVISSRWLTSGKTYIISHAGITNKWYKDFKELRLIQQIADEHDTVADLINKAENTSQRWILHQAGSSRGGEGPGGITWADRKELIADMLDGYHQIVGHTVIPKPEFVQETGKSSTFIDVLDTMTYFHEIDI
jgi:hypothetical protein